MDKIEHIVISGGGPSGLHTIGALSELAKCDVWQRSNIKTIYATSIGTVIGVCIALNIKWCDLISYSINRPWKSLFKIDIHGLFNGYFTKGIFGKSVYLNAVKSIFQNISTGATLADFFAKTGVEMHFFTVELNSFEIVNISHKTHPQLLLLDAVYMSCTLPGIVAPMCDTKKKTCYIDGGCLINYPLNECLLETGANINTVLGLRFYYCDTKDVFTDIVETSTMVDMLMTCIAKMSDHVSRHPIPTIPHEIICPTFHMTANVMKMVANSADIRAEWIEIGANVAKRYIMLAELRRKMTPIL